ncbi:hypothetical protein DMP08_08225 [Paraeggerthella hongkongensis]|uniref:Uncharacterized protein n=1 Tax=Paraeggerthella hongkongensis TaxID=230658 RepID=A0A3N0B8A9_9ACTN|nr:hypothetical protein DMP08_08225 [Paraeggerthella hongkongensis]
MAAASEDATGPFANTLLRSPLSMPDFLSWPPIRVHVFKGGPQARMKTVGNCATLGDEVRVRVATRLLCVAQALCARFCFDSARPVKTSEFYWSSNQDKGY